MQIRNQTADQGAMMNDDASFLRKCGIEVDRDWLIVIWLKCSRHQQSIPNLSDLERISEITRHS
jgi:hypothetical protein